MQQAGAPDPTVVVAKFNPPTAPGWFPPWWDKVEWLSAWHRESAIGSDAVAPWKNPMTGRLFLRALKALVRLRGDLQTEE